jgi:hypothetical protein
VTGHHTAVRLGQCAVSPRTAARRPSKSTDPTLLRHRSNCNDALSAQHGREPGARTLTTLTTLLVTDACDALLATLAPNPADDIAILMART